MPTGSIDYRGENPMISRLSERARGHHSNSIGHQLHRIATLIRTVSSAFLSIYGGNVGLSADKPSVPNIVFILADDLGYADLGCQGSAEVKSDP
jgi:hypothetical protein